MLTSLFGRCISVSAVVCVLLMFLFPLAQGNFQSTHGPVTALRSMRAFFLLVFSMMRAALALLAILVATRLFNSGRFLSGRTGQSWTADSILDARVLRC